MPAATLENDLQTLLDLTHGSATIPREGLESLLKAHNAPLDPKTFASGFEGWEKTERANEWRHGEEKRFAYNGGFDAFVGVTLRFNPTYNWWSATQYHGNSEPTVLFHSRTLETRGDFLRIAADSGIPATPKA